MEFVTEYRDYTGVGDKILPREIRKLTKGRITSVLRLMAVATGPKTSFAESMFEVPAGYRPWPACDHYQSAQFSKNFWRQSKTEMHPEWFSNAGKVADGVRIVVGPDGKPQDVQLINPIGQPSKQVVSTFMNQTYQPASCDGKPVIGMVSMEFTPE